MVLIIWHVYGLMNEGIGDCPLHAALHTMLLSHETDKSRSFGHSWGTSSANSSWWRPSRPQYPTIFTDYLNTLSSFHTYVHTPRFYTLCILYFYTHMYVHMYTSKLYLLCFLYLYTHMYVRTYLHTSKFQSSWTLIQLKKALYWSRRVNFAASLCKR